MHKLSWQLRCLRLCIPLLLCVSILLAVRLPLYSGQNPTTAIGVNVGGSRYYGGLYFADTAMSGGNWIEFGQNQWGQGVALYDDTGMRNPQFNDRGLPLYLNDGKMLRLLLWPFHAGYAGDPGNEIPRGQIAGGRWVVSWQGSADIRLDSFSQDQYLADASSGPATGMLKDGKRVYLLDPGASLGHLIVRELDPEDPLTDLSVHLPDPASPEERALNEAESLWHPSFLSTFDRLPFNHIRFMDWMHTNANPARDWSDRRLPRMILQNAGGIPRPPADGFPLSRNPGLAYEYIIDLSNEVETDPWICIPHMATDDYIRKMARLFKYGSDGVEPYTTQVDSPVFPPLNSERKLYIEYSNEVWSSGGSFPQGNYARDQAQALGISHPAFVAKRTVDVWRIFTEVFGEESSRLLKVAAVWSAQPDSYSRQYLEAVHAYGQAVDSPLLPDVISPTTYFGNGIQAWIYEQALLSRYDDQHWFLSPEDYVVNASSGNTRPLSFPKSSEYWFSTQFEEQLETTFREWKKRIFSGLKADGAGPDAVDRSGGFDELLQEVVASVYGQRIPLISYEGGPSLYTDDLDRGGVEDDGITTFVNALNRHPQMEELMDLHLNLARSKGLDTHAVFTDQSSWGKYGQWGHFEYPGQLMEDSPRWRQALLFEEEMRLIKDPDAVAPGDRPVFSELYPLLDGMRGKAYHAEIKAESPRGIQSMKIVASVLSKGLRIYQPPDEQHSVRITGLPESGGANYFMLRAVDSQGHAAWKIFSFAIEDRIGLLLQTNWEFPVDSLAVPLSNPAYVDSGLSWSGLDTGAPYQHGGGSAQFDEASGDGLDGTGVRTHFGEFFFQLALSQGGTVSLSDEEALASALTDNEYLSFTLVPDESKPLNLAGAEMELSWKRDRYHAPRKFSVFSSVEGLSSASSIYSTTESSPAKKVIKTRFRFPDDPVYNGLRDPVEVRLYFYQSHYAHRFSILGISIRQAASFHPPPENYDKWAETIEWAGMDSHPIADPNRDSIPNLLHALLSTDPLAGNKRMPLEISFHGSQRKWLRLEHRLNADFPGIESALLFSDDLNSWHLLEPDDKEVIEEVMLTEDGQLMRIFYIRMESHPENRFFRLQVSSE